MKDCLSRYHLNWNAIDLEGGFQYLRSYGSHCSAFVVPVRFALSVPSCGRTLSKKGERPVTVISFSQTQNGGSRQLLGH